MGKAKGDATFAVLWWRDDDPELLFADTTFPCGVVLLPNSRPLTCDPSPILLGPSPKSMSDPKVNPRLRRLPRVELLSRLKISSCRLKSEGAPFTSAGDNGVLLLPRV